MILHGFWPEHCHGKLLFKKSLQSIAWHRTAVACSLNMLLLNLAWKSTMTQKSFRSADGLPVIRIHMGNVKLGSNKPNQAPLLIPVERKALGNFSGIE